MSSQVGHAALPQEVKVEECKLLDSPKTVETYGRVREVLGLIAEKLPSIADGAAFAKACGDLDKLAGKLTQDRYRIGFIGISQGGKSTTAGFVVGATGDADNPAPPGGDGKAATAIATRIMPIQNKHPKCRDGEDHYVELVYLTTEQLRDRIRQIFGILEIEQAPEQSPQAWLEQCREHAKTHPKENVPDREVAIRLLEATIANPGLVQSQPLIEPGSFALEERRKCVLHPEEGQPAGKYALLREMRIWYHTDKAPESLELIDLPGLAVERVSDETLTMAFLPELNGAFLFQEQNQLESESAAKLTAKMRREYGDTIGGRIWMVVTKCDLLREDDEKQDLSNPNGKFKTIADKTRKGGFALGNVILVSNPVYRAVLRGASPPTAWVEARGKWMPDFDGAGQPVIPPAVAAHAGLLDAFRHLVLQGGVPMIIGLMKDRVEAAIRSETQSEAREVISRVVTAIREELEAAKQLGGMSNDQVVAAAIMHRTLKRIAKQYVGSDGHVRTMYSRMKSNLGTLHEKLGDPTEDPDEDEHMTLCTALMKKAMAVAKDEAGGIIDKVQKYVAEKIAADKVQENLAHDVPAIKSAIQAWHVNCQRIRDGRSPTGRTFREAVFETFVMPDELAARFRWGGRGRIGGHEHHDMMQAKIDAVTQEYAAEMSAAIADALTALADTYRKLGRDNSAPDSSQVADCDAAIAALSSCHS